MGGGLAFEDLIFLSWLVLMLVPPHPVYIVEDQRAPVHSLVTAYYACDGEWGAYFLLIWVWQYSAFVWDVPRALGVGVADSTGVGWII